jgi:hypothetical protein
LSGAPTPVPKFHKYVNGVVPVDVGVKLILVPAHVLLFVNVNEEVGAVTFTKMRILSLGTPALSTLNTSVSTLITLNMIMML